VRAACERNTQAKRGTEAPRSPDCPLSPSHRSSSHLPVHPPPLPLPPHPPRTQRQAHAVLSHRPRPHRRRRLRPRDRVLPRQAPGVRVQGQDPQTGLQIPGGVGAGHARARVDGRGAGQVPEAAAADRSGRGGAGHAVSEPHLRTGRRGGRTDNERASACFVSVCRRRLGEVWGEGRRERNVS